MVFLLVTLLYQFLLPLYGPLALSLSGTTREPCWGLHPDREAGSMGEEGVRLTLGCLGFLRLGEDLPLLWEMNLTLRVRAV